LAYEFLHTPSDLDKETRDVTHRIFEAGHVFENLSIRWLRAAGIDLLTHKKTAGLTSASFEA
jgi:hypothetical protein